MTNIDYSRINVEQCDFSFNIKNVLDLLKPYSDLTVIPVSEQKYYVEDCNDNDVLVPNFKYDYTIQLAENSTKLIVFDYCNGFYGFSLDGCIVTFKHSNGVVENDEKIKQYIEVMLGRVKNK